MYLFFKKTCYNVFVRVARKLPRKDIIMEKDRNFRILAIVAICIAIIGLSVGYAALQTTLTVNTTATAKAATWNVKFTNLGTPTLTGKAAVTNAATLTDTTVTIDVSVINPGDSATYTFDVTNAGTIDAKLSSITYTGVTEAAAKHMIYTLTYADGSAIAANDTLTAGATKNLKLTVTYDSNIASTDLPTTDQTQAITAVLLYVQK